MICSSQGFFSNDKQFYRSNKCNHSLIESDFSDGVVSIVFLRRLDAEGMNRCREKLKKLLSQNKNEKEPGDSLIIFDRIRSEIVDCLLGARIGRDASGFEIL